jgi:hypothetical protein
MLATLTIWLTGAAAALSVVEIFLSKRHKTRLSDKVTEAWNVLDDVKAWSFEEWVTNTLRVTGWLMWAAGFATGAIVVYKYLDLVSGKTALPGFGDNIYDVIVGPAVAFIGWVLFVRFVLPSEKTNRRLIALLLVTLAAISIIDLLVFAYSHLIRHDAVTLWSYCMLASPVIIMLLLAGFVTACVVTMLGLVYIASVILYVGEFVIRRIAEYPKGPVLALSALIGGIAALFKALGSG